MCPRFVTIFLYQEPFPKRFIGVAQAIKKRYNGCVLKKH